MSTGAGAGSCSDIVATATARAGDGSKEADQWLRRMVQWSIAIIPTRGRSAREGRREMRGGLGGVSLTLSHLLKRRSPLRLPCLSSGFVCFGLAKAKLNFRRFEAPALRPGSLSVELMILRSTRWYCDADETFNICTWWKCLRVAPRPLLLTICLELIALRHLTFTYSEFQRPHHKGRFGAGFASAL